MNSLKLAQSNGGKNSRKNMSESKASELGRRAVQVRWAKARCICGHLWEVHDGVCNSDRCKCINFKHKRKV